MEKGKYALVADSDDGSNSVLSRPSARISLEGTWSKLRISLPWTLTVIFASLSLLQVILFFGSESYWHSKTFGTYVSGYKTDFGQSQFRFALCFCGSILLTQVQGDVRKHMSVELKRFSGSPMFDKNGHMIIQNPDPLRYVGNPFEYPEIDENWETLTRGKIDDLIELQGAFIFGGLNLFQPYSTTTKSVGRYHASDRRTYRPFYFDHERGGTSGLWLGDR